MRQLYEAALSHAIDATEGWKRGNDLRPLLVNLAETCFHAGIPEEETVCQTLMHYPDADRFVLRTLIHTLYKECRGTRRGAAMTAEQAMLLRMEEFMERMTESTKAVIDHFGQHITYVNVMRNMSVSCDCEGVNAAPVVTPNAGILSSTDILALDQACVDLIYAMTEAEHHDLVERIETRHGLRQLSYMKELGMGNDRYILIDLDNGGKRITAAEAVKGLKPFVQE